MTLNKAKGKMFKSVGWTWNPIYGCDHNCPYCWARSLSERWNRSFEPRMIFNTLMDKLPDDGSWIFIGSMGDLFCYGMHREDIKELFYRLEDYEGSCKFLLQTKNPLRAISFLDSLYKVQDKIIIGTTIETNRETLGHAPKTRERYASMVFFDNLGFDTFLSLEPLADFDLEILLNWIIEIQPEAVEIGLENYSNYTIKPPEDKIKNLIFWLKDEGIPFILKDNLAHLESMEVIQ